MKIVSEYISVLLYLLFYYSEFNSNAKWTRSCKCIQEIQICLQHFLSCPVLKLSKINRTLVEYAYLKMSHVAGYHSNYKFL